MRGPAPYQVVGWTAIAIGALVSWASAVSANSTWVLIGHDATDVQDLTFWMQRFLPEHVSLLVGAEFFISALLVVSGVALLHQLRWGARIIAAIAWFGVAYIAVAAVAVAWALTSFALEAEVPLTPTLLRGFALFAATKYRVAVVMCALIVGIWVLRGWEAAEQPVAADGASRRQ